MLIRNLVATRPVAGENTIRAGARTLLAKHKVLTLPKKSLPIGIPVDMQQWNSEKYPGILACVFRDRHTSASAARCCSLVPYRHLVQLRYVVQPCCLQPIRKEVAVTPRHCNHSSVHRSRALFLSPGCRSSLGMEHETSPAFPPSRIRTSSNQGDKYETRLYGTATWCSSDARSGYVQVAAPDTRATRH